MSFSFGFGGDDIEQEGSNDVSMDDVAYVPHRGQAAETGSLARKQNTTATSTNNNKNHTQTAFPTGRDLLPARSHDLSDLLASLPERISYSTLHVRLDDGGVVRIPRRELWDVRMQIMAEEEEGDGDGMGPAGDGLGKEDVKTGVYEGGFKSWECSVDLVRVLAGRRHGEGSEEKTPTRRRVLEMGCGTALPSLALLQWEFSRGGSGLELCLADYNPTVLQLVTVPNLLLSWALASSSEVDWEDEGEFEISPEVLRRFVDELVARRIELRFLSGAWSDNFVGLFLRDRVVAGDASQLLVLAAETIYSPVALRSFGDTLMDILAVEQDKGTALVGAKKVYFGVGGSMEDFCSLVVAKHGRVVGIREEEGGVRREVVEVTTQVL